MLIFNLKKVKFDNNSNSHYYYYIPQLFYLSLPAPGSLLRSPGLWHRASLWLVYLDVILQLHQGFETRDMTGQLEEHTRHIVNKD